MSESGVGRRNVGSSIKYMSVRCLLWKRCYFPSFVHINSHHTFGCSIFQGGSSRFHVANNFRGKSYRNRNTYTARLCTLHTHCTCSRGTSVYKHIVRKAVNTPVLMLFTLYPKQNLSSRTGRLCSHLIPLFLT